MTLPPVDFSVLHAAIKSGLQTQFPSVTVDYAYNRPGATLPVPCLLIDFESFDPDQLQNTGTNQLAVLLRFSIECVTSYKIESATVSGKLNARILAGAVAAFVERNKWGLQTVTPGRFKSSAPENFYSKDLNYESWSVKWTHCAFLGANAWDTTGEPTAEGIWWGQAPNIGEDHVSDYKDAEDYIVLPPVDPRSENIEIDPAGSQVVGVPFTAIARTSSELSPVISLVSGPATITGTATGPAGETIATILPSATGIVVIAANAPSDHTFSTPAQMTRSVEILRLPQTITFGGISNKKQGSAPFGLSATSSSGLPVTFSVVSGPATVIGSTLTLTGVGSVTVQASQTGSARYLAATPVTRTFTVTPIIYSSSSICNNINTGAVCGNWSASYNIIGGSLTNASGTLVANCTYGSLNVIVNASIVSGAWVGTWSETGEGPAPYPSVQNGTFTALIGSDGGPVNTSFGSDILLNQGSAGYVAYMTYGTVTTTQV